MTGVQTCALPIYCLTSLLFPSHDINAANEVGIAKFFNQEINILELAQRTIKAYRYFENAIPKTLDEVFEIDKEVRQYCLH